MAFESLDGVERLFQNGGAAVFTLEKGAKIEEATVKKAVEKNGLQLVRFASEKRPVAHKAYNLGIKPVT